VPLILPFEDPMFCQKSVPKIWGKNSPKTSQKSLTKTPQKFGGTKTFIYF